MARVAGAVGVEQLATTCNVTALFEKIFYRSEAALKTAEIAARASAS